LALEEPVAAGKAEASRLGPESEASRRIPDLERLASNLRDRVGDFIQRWTAVANYLKSLEGDSTGVHVWILDLRRNVTREATLLLRDVIELGEYRGLAHNVPDVIHATVVLVCDGVNLVVTRAELKEAKELGDVFREQIADRLAEAEDEYATVVSLIPRQERRRAVDSSDTMGTHEAV
jgi:hypothetical protein